MTNDTSNVTTLRKPRKAAAKKVAEPVAAKKTGGQRPDTAERDEHAWKHLKDVKAGLTLAELNDKLGGLPGKQTFMSLYRLRVAGRIKEDGKRDGKKVWKAVGR